MKEKEVLIFDLDGTLVDTTHIGFRKVNKNLARLGLPPVSEDFLRLHWGKKAEEIFTLICQEAGATEGQLADFIEYDKTMIEEYHIHPGIRWMLESLHSQGFLLGLVASRTQESFNLICNRIGLDCRYFSFLQTATHYYHHKPSGRVFGPMINWARRRGYSPEQIVYFGDTVNYDFAATQNSNPPIDFVGIVSGANTKEEFLAAGLPVERIVPSFEDFPLFLQSMIRAKVAMS